MHRAGSLRIAAALTVLPALYAGGSQSQPLQDPIPEEIRKGDLVVGATEFVRAPQTSDSAEEGATNKAYARIQYLVPVGDGSGRLILNDLRGLLYLTDESG